MSLPQRDETGKKGGTRAKSKAGPGATRGVASISEVLQSWIKENKASERLSEGTIFSRWKEIVGDEIGARTRVIQSSGGELVIEVCSSALLNELSTYYRQEILDSLRQTEEFRGIQKIKFRSGSFPVENT